MSLHRWVPMMTRWSRPALVLVAGLSEQDFDFLRHFDLPRVFLAGVDLLRGGCGQVHDWHGTVRRQFDERLHGA
jgi:hypothetical protein